MTRTIFKRLTAPAILALSCVIGFLSLPHAAEPEREASGLLKRSAFSIPLAKLSIGFDEETHELSSVRVSYEGSSGYVVITPYDDERIKITSEGRTKEIIREQPDLAYQTSEFELDELVKVSRTLIATLNIFEGDLKSGRWDRLVYLDAYLPRFLRGYYYLCDAIRGSRDALPRNSQIPEESFDVSLNSPKSDARMTQWRTDAEYAIKLRIISKELTYQLKQWESKAKKNRKSPELFMDTKVKDAFGLFIHIYFNLKPPPGVNFKFGRHL